MFLPVAGHATIRTEDIAQMGEGQVPGCWASASVICG